MNSSPQTRLTCKALLYAADKRCAATCSLLIQHLHTAMQAINICTQPYRHSAYVCMHYTHNVGLMHACRLLHACSHFIQHVHAGTCRHAGTCSRMCRSCGPRACIASSQTCMQKLADTGAPGCMRHFGYQVCMHACMHACTSSNATRSTGG